MLGVMVNVDDMHPAMKIEIVLRYRKKERGGECQRDSSAITSRFEFRLSSTLNLYTVNQ